jgi:hypothetical protein
MFFFKKLIQLIFINNIKNKSIYKTNFILINEVLLEYIYIYKNIFFIHNIFLLELYKIYFFFIKFYDKLILKNKRNIFLFTLKVSNLNKISIISFIYSLNTFFLKKNLLSIYFFVFFNKLFFYKNNILCNFKFLYFNYSLNFNKEQKFNKLKLYNSFIIFSSFVFFYKLFIKKYNFLLTKVFKHLKVDVLDYFQNILFLKDLTYFNFSDFFFFFNFFKLFFFKSYFGNLFNFLSLNKVFFSKNYYFLFFFIINYNRFSIFNYRKFSFLFFNKISFIDIYLFMIFFFFKFYKYLFVIDTYKFSKQLIRFNYNLILKNNISNFVFNIKFFKNNRLNTLNLYEIKKIILSLKNNIILNFLYKNLFIPKLYFKFFYNLEYFYFYKKLFIQMQFNFFYFYNFFFHRFFFNNSLTNGIKEIILKNIAIKKFNIEKNTILNVYKNYLLSSLVIKNINFIKKKYKNEDFFINFFSKNLYYLNFFYDLKLNEFNLFYFLNNLMFFKFFLKKKFKLNSLNKIIIFSFYMNLYDSYFFYNKQLSYVFNNNLYLNYNYLLNNYVNYLFYILYFNKKLYKNFFYSNFYFFNGYLSFYSILLIESYNLSLEYYNNNCDNYSIRFKNIKLNIPYLVDSSNSFIRNNVSFFDTSFTDNNVFLNSNKFYNTRFDYSLNYETIILYKFLWKESILIDSLKNTYLQIELIKKYNLNFFFSKKLSFFYLNLINKNYNSYLLNKNKILLEKKGKILNKSQRNSNLDILQEEFLDKKKLKVKPYSMYDYINMNVFNFRSYYFNLFLDTYNLKLYKLNFYLINSFFFFFFDFYFKYLFKLQTLSYILKYEYNLSLSSYYYFGPINLKSNVINITDNTTSFFNLLTLNLFTFNKILKISNNFFIYNFYYLYIFFYYIYLGVVYKNFLNKLNTKAFFLTFAEFGSDYSSLVTLNQFSNEFETDFDLNLDESKGYYFHDDLNSLDSDEIDEYFGFYFNWSSEVFNSIGLNEQLEDIDYKNTIITDSPFFNFSLLKNFVYFKLIIYSYYFYDLLSIFFFYIFVIFILDIILIIYSFIFSIFFFFCRCYGLFLYFFFSFLLLVYNSIRYIFFRIFCFFNTINYDFYLYPIYYFNFFFVLVFESILLLINFKYIFRFFSYFFLLFKSIYKFFFLIFKFFFFNFLIYLIFYYSLIYYDVLYLVLNKYINFYNYNPIYYIYSLLYFILIFFFLELNLTKISRYFWELRYIYLIVVLTILGFLEFSNNIAFLFFNFFDTNLYFYKYYYLKYNILNKRVSQAIYHYYLFSNDTFFDYHLINKTRKANIHFDNLLYKRWLKMYSNILFTESNNYFFSNYYFYKIDYFLKDPFFLKSGFNKLFKKLDILYAFNTKNYVIYPKTFYNFFNQINFFFKNFFNNIYIYFDFYIKELYKINFFIIFSNIKIPNFYVSDYKFDFEVLNLNVIFFSNVNNYFYYFYKLESNNLFLYLENNNVFDNNVIDLKLKFNFLNKYLFFENIYNNIFLTIFLSELGYSNKKIYYKYLVNLLFFQAASLKYQLSENFLDSKQYTHDFLYFLLQYNKFYNKNPLIYSYISKDDLLKIKSYSKQLSYLIHYNLKQSLWNQYEGDISNYVFFYGRKWKLSHKKYRGLTLAEYFYELKKKKKKKFYKQHIKRNKLLKSMYSYFAYPRLYKKIEDSKLIKNYPVKNPKYQNRLVDLYVYKIKDRTFIKNSIHQVLPSGYHYPREYLIYKNYDILPEKYINDLYAPNLSYHENFIDLDELEIDEALIFPKYLYNYSKYVISMENYKRNYNYNLKSVEFIPVYMFYNFVDFPKYHDYQDFINPKAFRPFKKNIKFKYREDFLFHKYFIPDFGFYGSDLWFLSYKNKKSFMFDDFLTGPQKNKVSFTKKFY